MKFGIIAHYSSMKEEFSYLEKLLDCKLIFKVGVLELALKTAKKLETIHGVDAIIASGMTVAAIKDKINIPMIPLYTSNFSIAESIVEAQHQKSKTVFCGLSSEHKKYDFSKIKKIIGEEVEYYEFDSIDKTDEVVTRALKEGKKLIITTASCLISKAKERGLETVLIQTKKEDFIEAIEYAKDVVEIRNKEVVKNKWLNVVVENTTQGIIALDKDKKIIVFNAEAQRLTNIANVDAIIGKTMKELDEKYPVFKKILNVKDHISVVVKDQIEMLIHKHKILRRNDYHGTVIVVASVQSVEMMEMVTRKKLNPKGFIAESNFDDIKGFSKAIKEAKRKAIMYAKSNSNILLYGESGTGKELFAQSIHNYSPCKGGPFLAVNCATFSETLLESELFGYDKGAFTGANNEGKKGLFELAHNGTLFLDEIGEMPIVLQARLLRVLQERVIRRIGGEMNTPINVRIICATNKNLKEAVKNNEFREDLFYRINVLNVNLPPLRVRKEDIKSIARDIVNRVSKKQNKEIYISEEQLNRLKMYDWHGNVRELINFIERLVAVTEVYKVEEELFEFLFNELMDLEDEFIKPKVATFEKHRSDEYMQIPVSNMKEMEAHIIQFMVDRYSGDKKKISEALGVSQTTLWRRIKDVDGTLN